MEIGAGAMTLILNFPWNKTQPLLWIAFFILLASVQHQIKPLNDQEILHLKKSNEISQTMGKPHSRWHELDEHDLRVFFKRKSEVLPDFKKDFQKAAKEFELPWQLIAAVSYQESHWKPEARSYTGVRGLMQLTEETAQAMGIEDRRDPRQSIYGGTKYLSFLYEMIPTTINTSDRLALVLAAYNIGYGHLQDGQRLAEQLGKNPWAWKDLKTVLPLLNQQKYFSKTQFGQARGHETVRFVERTRSFYELLIVQN